MVERHERTDILIIGSGAAGLSAAIEARCAGASVIVVEKMNLTGGNTRISDGALSAAGNFVQQRKGIQDSPELFYEDMLRAGLGLNHPHLARLVAEKGAEAIHWTTKVLGVQYQDRLDRFGGHSVARTVTTRSHSGVDIIRGQTALLKRMGVEIRIRCALGELLTNREGRICGAKVLYGYRFDNETFDATGTIRAERAVIVAAGGFGNDLPFRMLQNPVLNDVIDSTNQRGATAEALGEALKKGAAPVHLSWIQTGPWGCPDEKGYGKGARFASYSVFPCGIVVDPADGRRVVNEWADRRRRSDALLKAGYPCLGIVDSTGAAKEPKSLAFCLERGKIKKFQTIAELAEAYGVPSEALEETVRRYNNAVRSKTTDELGKPLGKGARTLDRPPFYCMRLWPKVHHTPGGVAIDSRARVLDVKGRPIAGLFAAGEFCGGVHGADRLGGCALVECLVFGRIAGRQAARHPLL